MATPYLLYGFLLLMLGIAAFGVHLRHRQIAHVRGLAGDDTKAVAYEIAKQHFGIASDLFDTALAMGLILFGLDRIHQAVAAVLAPGIVTGVVFLLAVAAVTGLAELPWAAWRAFILEARFGFNRQTALGFLRDGLKEAAISLPLSAGLFFVILWCMQALAGLWWLYAWAVVVAVLFGLQIVFPRWIAPLFNTFAPVTGELRNRLETLLHRCGFEPSALLTMDASKRSLHGNAYLSGFGRHKRIVLFDTLLAAHPPEEVEAILAHELGHFKLRHIHLSLLRMLVLSFLAFLAVGAIARQPWFLPGFGIAANDDPMALMVCLMASSVLSPLLALVGNAFSRRHERQADGFARDMVGAAPMIAALRTLSRENAQPLSADPLYALCTYSHPSIAERMALLGK